MTAFVIFLSIAILLQHFYFRNKLMLKEDEKRQLRLCMKGLELDRIRVIKSALLKNAELSAKDKSNQLLKNEIQTLTRKLQNV
jgi:hypothetical protein